MSTVQELHDVEWCTNDAAVLAETERLGDGDIGASERLDDLIFPVDSVRGLGEDFARRFLAEHQFASIGSGELVRGVRLTKTELFKEDGSAFNC